MTEDNYLSSNSSNEDSEAFSHAKRNQQYVSYRKEIFFQGRSKKYPGNRDAQRHHFKSRDPGEDDKKAVFSPKTKSHGHRTSSHKHEDPCGAEFDDKMATFSPIAKSHGHRTRSPIQEQEDPCDAEFDAKMATFSPIAKSHHHRTRNPIQEQEDPCDAEFDDKIGTLSPTAKSHRHRTCNHIHHHKGPCGTEFDAENAVLSPVAKSHRHRTSSHIHKHEDPCGAEFDAFSHNKRNQQYASSTKENVSSRHSKKSPGHRHSSRHHSKSRDHSENDERAAFTPVAKSHSHKTTSHTHKQEYLCDAGAVINLGQIGKGPTLWRKSREQHRKEKEAATTIQSAWRGYQVRRDMSTLDEAATQIQAAFRGYQTRKELPLGLSGFSWISGEEINKKMRDKCKNSIFSERPLGLCDCSWISGEEINKKMRDKSKSSIFPELPLGLYDSSWISEEQLNKKTRDKSKSNSLPDGLHCFEEFELAPGVRVGRESICIPSGKQGSFPKSLEESAALQPLLDRNSPQKGVLVPPILKQSLDDSDVRCGCESICLPSGKQRSLPKSLEESVGALQPLLDMNSPQIGVLVPSILKQCLDDADAAIQAPLSGHQTSPKAISAMLQGKQNLGKPYCSNLTIEKIVRKQLASGHTLEQHEVREIIAKSSGLSVRSIPRVRNINILAIVKRMPASVCKKPGVTIRVSSPNAVVQGYQKDMSGGVQGLYTIKNRYSQRPSQILIHVNLQNEKDVECCP